MICEARTETLLLDKGVPVHVVAARCGHDPAVLLRSYAKRTRKADTSAAAVMKPKAHRTKWSAILCTLDGRELTPVHTIRTDTQLDAECEIAHAVEQGQRGYVLPPKTAWGGRQ